jgi:hypothetical protein
MKSQKASRLSIKTETVRNLSTTDLVVVVGGDTERAPGTSTFGNGSLNKSRFALLTCTRP